MLRAAESLASLATELRFFSSPYGGVKLDPKLSLDLEVLLALCARKDAEALRKALRAEGRGSNKYVRLRAQGIHASKET